MDGLDNYGSEYIRIRFKPALIEKSAKLEQSARMLGKGCLSRTSFMEKHALLVGRFMLGIQNLLAATSEEKKDFVPWTSHLSNKDFAILLWEFYQVTTDLEKIKILAECLEDWRENQRSFSIAALRSLTLLARMLDPDLWGVISWRTLGCLGFESMTELKKMRLYSSPASIQREFAVLSPRDIVASTVAMRQLIQPELPTTARVATALFSVSLDLWPIDATFERQENPSAVTKAGCEAFPAFILGSTP